MSLKGEILITTQSQAMLMQDSSVGMNNKCAYPVTGVVQDKAAKTLFITKCPGCSFLVMEQGELDCDS